MRNSYKEQFELESCTSSSEDCCIGPEGPPGKDAPLIRTAYITYVDSLYGNDTTGVPEVLNYPFRSFEAALIKTLFFQSARPGSRWIIQVGVGKFPGQTLSGIRDITIRGQGEYTEFGPIEVSASKIIIKELVMKGTVLTGTMLGAVTAGTFSLADGGEVLLENVTIEAPQGVGTVPILNEGGTVDIVRSSALKYVSAEETTPSVYLSSGDSDAVTNIAQSFLSFRGVSFDSKNLRAPVLSPINLSFIRDSNISSNSLVKSTNNNFIVRDLPDNISTTSYSGLPGAAGQITASNDTVDIPIEIGPVLFAPASNYSVAQQEGSGKIVVSNNRVETNASVISSSVTGGGLLLLQTTAYGDNPVPTSQVGDVVENGTDQGGSLWYSGAFSINSLDKDQDYAIQANGKEYAIYLTENNLTITLPPLTARPGRILEISLFGPNALNATIKAQPGELISIYGLAGVPSITLGGGFNPAGVRLQSSGTGTGIVWRQMFG